MPFPIVFLLSKIGNQTFQGTGVLISPDEVLTSAHLVYSSDYGPATQLLAIPGYDGSNVPPYGTAPGVSIRFWMIDDPGFVIPLGEVRYDYAVVHLSSSFSIGAVGLQTNFTSGSVNVSGYPAAAGGQMATNQAYVASDPTYDVLYGAAGLSPGSSGSPAWITGSDGMAYAVGIASCGGGGTDYFTQITTEVFSQIQSWAIQDDGAPTPMPNNIGCPGLHSQYDVAPNPLNGQAIIVDTALGGGRQDVPNLHSIMFADGIGRFDSTGDAENAARLYQAALGRAPDVSGLDYWTAQLDTHTLDIDGAALGFINSNEFQGKYGTINNTGFVDQLYQNVLHRAPDIGGEQYWVAQLNSGTSRAHILSGFSNSIENRLNTRGTIGDPHMAEAHRLYQAAFDRTPDIPGLSYWTAQLDGGETPLQAAQGFVTSNEFTLMFSGLDTYGFVDQLYVNVLHRAADPSGEQYWVGRLGSGTSKAEVLLGFSDSVENRLNTSQATHDAWVYLSA